MEVKYPDIYDISNYDEWKKKFVRKEILTNEWDLICNEVSTDIFEIPMFTSEYCDKLVENLKGDKGNPLTVWGHECEELTIPDEVFQVIGTLIQDHVMNAFLSSVDDRYTEFSKNDVGG